MESMIWKNSEASIGGVLQNKVFVKISQNSRENIGTRVSFLTKLHASGDYFWRLLILIKLAF